MDMLDDELSLIGKKIKEINSEYKRSYQALKIAALAPTALCIYGIVIGSPVPIAISAGVALLSVFAICAVIDSPDILEQKENILKRHKMDYEFYKINGKEVRNINEKDREILLRLVKIYYKEFNNKPQVQMAIESYSQPQRFEFLTE